MRDFLPVKLWWIRWSDNLYLATTQNAEMRNENTFLFSSIHSLEPTRSLFLSQILQFLRALCFRAYHQKGHCSGYCRFKRSDIKICKLMFEEEKIRYENPLEQFATNNSLWPQVPAQKNGWGKSSKSVSRMNPLKRLSYGKLVKLLYVVACVGLFFEEAYECLVHYVSE